MHPYLKKMITKTVIRSLVVALLTAGILFPIYNNTLNIAKTKIIEDNYTLVKSTFQTMENNLSNIKRLSNEINNNKTIKYFMNKNEVDFLSEVGKINDAKEYLFSSTVYLTDFINDFYIMFNKSDILFTSTRVFERKIEFYGKFFKYSDMTYDQWIDKTLNNNQQVWPNKSVYTYDAGDIDIVTVSFIQGSQEMLGQSGVMCVTISKEKLLSSFLIPQITDRGFLYIADQSGNIIVSHNYEDAVLEGLHEGMQERVINGENSTIIRFVSSNYGLELVTSIPNSEFYSMYKPLKNMLSMYIFIATLLTVLLYSFFAYRNYSPLKNLVYHISKLDSRKYGVRNEYEYIKKVIDDINTSRIRLNTNYEDIRKSAASGNFERLIRGSVYSKIDYEAAIRCIGTMPAPYVIIVCTTPQRTSDDSEIAFDVTLQEVAKGLFADNTHINRSGNQIIILTGCQRDEKSVNDLKNVLIRFSEVIFHILGHSLFFGVSSVYDSIENISTAYDEAKYCIHVGEMHDDDRMAFYGELPTTSNDVFVSVNDEQRLLEMLLCGDLEGVLKIFNSVKAKTMERSSISKMEFEHIFFSLRGAIHHAIYKMPHTAGMFQLPEYDHNQNFVLLFDSLVEAGTAVCNHINQNKKSHNEQLKSDLLKFIYDNYNDSNLCIKMISSHFNIADKYVSIFIKEQTGRTYMEHIESLRLEKSIELLKQNKFNINDISSMVGFVNHNTFYKAFKRKYGISPTAFKTKE